MKSLVMALCITLPALAQEKTEGYQFKSVVDLPATPVKDQVSATSTITKRCKDDNNTCSNTGIFAFEDDKKNVIVPVCEKYTLTIKEAAAYFNVGTKKLRRLAEENTDRYSDK